MSTYTFKRRSYRNICTGGGQIEFIPVFRKRILKLKAETGKFPGEINCSYRIYPKGGGMNVVFFVQRSSHGIPVGDMVMCAPVSENSGEFSVSGLKPGKEYFVVGAASETGKLTSEDLREFVTDIAVAGRT